MARAPRQNRSSGPKVVFAVVTTGPSGGPGHAGTGSRTSERRGIVPFYPAPRVGLSQGPPTIPPAASGAAAPGIDRYAAVEVIVGQSLTREHCATPHRSVGAATTPGHRLLHVPHNAPRCTPLLMRGRRWDAHVSHPFVPTSRQVNCAACMRDGARAAAASCPWRGTWLGSRRHAHDINSRFSVTLGGACSHSACTPNVESGLTLSGQRRATDTPTHTDGTDLWRDGLRSTLGGGCESFCKERIGAELPAEAESQRSIIYSGFGSVRGPRHGSARCATRATLRTCPSPPRTCRRAAELISTAAETRQARLAYRTLDFSVPMGT